MDGVAKANSGHLGLPLGAADIGAVLFGMKLSYNPEDPTWINRDRFILSAGHGSMFIYSWLHIAGYALPKEELVNFRQEGSMTPGHPEFPSSSHSTPGIEGTTGPLGQGVSNAVGMAAAAKMAGARFNTPDHTIFDHNVVALCGDGCLQEGVSAEAAAFAAHNKLDNLIYIFDSNDVTLDKMADFTQSEDVGMRFQAYGWDVQIIDGHDMAAMAAAYDQAKTTKNGKPKMIICKTVIGKGIDAVAGSSKAHGEAGVKYIEESKKALGLPAEPFLCV
jgi:transketolase